MQFNMVHHISGHHSRVGQVESAAQTKSAPPSDSLTLVYHLIHPSTLFPKVLSSQHSLLLLGSICSCLAPFAHTNAGKEGSMAELILSKECE
jgi:hypothetical protein